VSDTPVLQTYVVPAYFHVHAFDAQEAINATLSLMEAMYLDNDPHAPGFVSETYVGNEKEVVVAPKEPEDDDPQCVCGVYRSEHAMMGCQEGFQTAEQWRSEKQVIYDHVRMEDEGDIAPGWEWWDR